MTLGRCPSRIFCPRGTPPRPLTLSLSTLKLKPQNFIPKSYRGYSKLRTRTGPRKVLCS